MGGARAFVIWIWLGGLVMSMGGLLALTDKRYRLKKSVTQRSLQTAALEDSATEAKA